MRTVARRALRLLVSHRQAAELRRGKRPADGGLGPGNPLFIISSVYKPLPPSPLLMWTCACDLYHLCPLLLHVPVFPHPPFTTGTTKETAFESSTLRCLNHLPHPLQTPISAVDVPPHLKKNRPAGGNLSIYPCFHPRFPRSAIWWVS